MVDDRRDRCASVTGERMSDAPRRLFAAALWLLHVAVAGLVPLADAQLEDRAVDPVVHVESGDRPLCPSHDHLQCQLCRHAGANLVGADGGSQMSARLSVVDDDAAATTSLLRCAETGFPLGARAPPLA